MDIFVACLLFAVGVALVVKGGDIFVDAASFIAKALRVPSFIIGATIVSLATTLPEMIVSSIAAAEGSADMAVGNAIGSVTANTALILGVAMVAMNITCDRKKYAVPLILLIVASGAVWFFCIEGSLSVLGSIVLALIFIGFMTYNVISAKKSVGELQEELASEVEESMEQSKPERKAVIKNIVLFIVGAAAIVGGSQLMVTYGSELAVKIGVDERIIAVTLVAVGTSLPELVTTITAIIKKESALSVGNIIGANIIDISLVLPVCSIVSGQQLPVSAASLGMDFPACFAVTLVAMLPMLFKQKAYKLQGILLLALYAVYMVITVL